MDWFLRLSLSLAVSSLKSTVIPLPLTEVSCAVVFIAATFFMSMEFGEGGRQVRGLWPLAWSQAQDDCWLLDPVLPTGDHGQKPIAVLAGGLLLMPVHGTLSRSFLCLATCPTVIQ